MKFGYKEIKEFAENHEDERVRIMYRRLHESRSKSAKWCDEVEKLKKENELLYDSLPIIDNRTVNLARKLLKKPFQQKQAIEVIQSLISENAQLRKGWCVESEKRMKEWSNEGEKLTELHKVIHELRRSIDSHKDKIASLEAACEYWKSKYDEIN